MSAKDKAGSRAAAKGRAASQGKAASGGNFAEDANAAARAVTRNQFGHANERTAFIADAWAVYAKTHPHVTLSEFKEKLHVEMKRGTVALSRLDFPEGIPKHMWQAYRNSEMTIDLDTNRVVHNPTGRESSTVRHMIRWKL